MFFVFEATTGLNILLYRQLAVTDLSSVNPVIDAVYICFLKEGLKY